MPSKASSDRPVVGGLSPAQLPDVFRKLATGARVEQINGRKRMLLNPGKPLSHREKLTAALTLSFYRAKQAALRNAKP